MPAADSRMPAMGDRCRNGSKIVVITADVHDTTATATMTFWLLCNLACDVHPRYSTAAVPVNP